MIKSVLYYCVIINISIAALLPMIWFHKKKKKT